MEEENIEIEQINHTQNTAHIFELISMTCELD